MNHAVPRRFNFGKWIMVAFMTAGLIAVITTYRLWLPATQELIAKLRTASTAIPGQEADAHDEHEHHDHDHPGHKEENSIEISEQARGNIGLQVAKVALSDYDRTVNVPGIVIERRGRSKLDITAPLTGVVTKVLPTEGVAVLPGEVLFEMRLTHEELVQAQADLLKTTEELDVIGREVKRLEDVTKGGAVAGKTLLERVYERQRQEAVLRAQKQALLLHGLSEEQVDTILQTRKLLSTLVVKVPTGDVPNADEEKPPLYQVQELKVERGQHVTAGDSLAVLTDHTALSVEGEAFEQDSQFIFEAMEKKSPVSAILESQSAGPVVLDGLQIQFVSSRVEPESRALHFYVSLPNKLVRDTGPDTSPRFIDWQYKPGQRMLLRIPVERWAERIVLPINAIAQDGVETYVFRANGDHFDRQPVRVEYRDQLTAVIANDGSLFPGDEVTLSGAQQLQLALKNKAGGGVDPHAGHNH